MRSALQSWSVPLLLAGAVAAQGTVGLSFVSGPTVSTAFSPATLGNGITNVAQVSMIPHPTGARDTWLGGMSVLGLSAALGGSGSYDLVAFTYNRGTNVVTLNANAALFNTTGAEFALNWGRDGTYAVADRPTGVHQALAATPGGVLALPLPVAGIGAAYVDPCASTIGGSNVLFYVNPAGGLAWRVHDVLTATLTGPTNLATGAPAGGNLAHSPWPMVGSDGDAEGLIACEANSTFSASDWNWQGDLNPATSPIAQQPTPGSPFENNGCEAFGRVYMPQSTASYSVLEFDVVGLLGDSVPAAGGTLDLTAFSPAKNAGTPDVTIFVISASYLPAPLPIAGINNALGIDPLTVLVLGFATHNTASGRGVYSTPTPPLGVGVIPVQGVTFIGGGGVHFTSTAAITIVPGPTGSPGPDPGTRALSVPGTFPSVPARRADHRRPRDARRRAAPRARPTCAAPTARAAPAHQPPRDQRGGLRLPRHGADACRPSCRNAPTEGIRRLTHSLTHSRSCMRPQLHTSCIPLLLTGAVAAQGTVGLSLVSGPRISSAFAPATLGNGIKNVAQVSMIPHPTGGRDTWLGGMSVTGLSAALGGRGTYDVVAFTYDRRTDVVTLNANAATFNTTGAEFALNWGRDGTYAVADRPTGAFQATTGTPGGVLGAAVAVTGAGTVYVDPCPSRIGGSNVLFFATPAGGIAWRVHDVPNATLTGATNLVTTPPGGGALAHSPWPMVGGDGDAEGLIACETDSTAFTESDWNWQGDRDAATSRIVQQPTLDLWENNGCEAFGRVYMPQSTATHKMLEFDVVGLLGDSVPAAGGTLDLTAFAPAKTTGTPDLTIFVIGASYLPAPLLVPGIGNALGIQVTPLLVLGLASHDTASGRGVWSTPTPPLSVGVIPVQAVTFVGGGAPHFTSTAAITIVP